MTGAGSLPVAKLRARLCGVIFMMLTTAVRSLPGKCQGRTEAETAPSNPPGSSFREIVFHDESPLIFKAPVHIVNKARRRRHVLLFQIFNQSFMFFD